MVHFTCYRSHSETVSSLVLLTSSHVVTPSLFLQRGVPSFDTVSSHCGLQVILKNLQWSHTGSHRHTHTQTYIKKQNKEKIHTHTKKTLKWGRWHCSVVKAPASLRFREHTWCKGISEPHKLFSNRHTCALLCVYVHKHTHTEIE